MCEFMRCPFGNHAFLVTGIDESQILLPVIVKAKRPAGFLAGRTGDLVIELNLIRDTLYGRYVGVATAGGPILLNEFLYPLGSGQRDILAVAQSRAEFSVIDCMAAESRFRDPGSLAVFFYFVKQGVR